MQFISDVIETKSLGKQDVNVRDASVDLDKQDQIRFFESIYERFHQAGQTAGGINDRYYRIGKEIVRLRFAGPALVSHFTPAFSHVEVEPIENPALTICLWDSISTNTKMPLLVDSLLALLCFRWYERLDTRREIKGFHSDRIRTIFHFGPNILSLLDTSRNVAIYWLKDASKTPYYEKGYPFTTIFNWWMESQNQQCVHAAAMGMESGGVLMPGKSGSGKSTTSLACLNSDLLYVSDDTSLVTCDPVPYVHSLYNTAKIEDFQRLPALSSLISNPERVEGEKGMLFVQKHFPKKIIKGFPLKAILVPRITGKPFTTIQPTSAGLALKALAPSTILQLPGAGMKALRIMSQLVKKVPCYSLELGTNMQEIPQVISEFLAKRSVTH